MVVPLKLEKLLLRDFLALMNLEKYIRSVILFCRLIFAGNFMLLTQCVKVEFNVFNFRIITSNFYVLASFVLSYVQLSVSHLKAQSL